MFHSLSTQNQEQGIFQVDGFILGVQSRYEGVSNDANLGVPRHVVAGLEG